MTRYPGKQLKEGNFILAHSLRMQSIMLGKVCRWSTRNKRHAGAGGTQGMQEHEEHEEHEACRSRRGPRHAGA